MKSIRADYWKSQARKYCDFCKCWIADNRPSVEFHEKGRRHKDNVAKRLNFITKKSRRDEQASIKVDAAMAQMEAAALEAYRKDVENNADMTSKAINKKLHEENLAISGAGVSGKKLWREAKTDSDQTYYWNVLTNETTWEAPADGHLSLSEQKDDESKKQWAEYQKKQILQTRKRNEEEQKQKDEERAAEAREKMKERRVEALEPITSAPLIPEGKNDPYGQWKTVQIIQKEDIPEVNEVPETTDDTERNPQETPVKEFKEKTIESLGNEKVAFKKRKFNTSNKRNTRVRTDDD